MRAATTPLRHPLLSCGHELEAGTREYAVHLGATWCWPCASERAHALAQRGMPLTLRREGEVLVPLGGGEPVLWVTERYEGSPVLLASGQGWDWRGAVSELDPAFVTVCSVVGSRRARVADAA